MRFIQRELMKYVFFSKAKYVFFSNADKLTELDFLSR